MINPSFTLPWRAWLLLRRGDAPAAAAPAPRWQPPIELSERTLDDIGAPDWLRAQARTERLRDDVAWRLDRQGW